MSSELQQNNRTRVVLITGASRGIGQAVAAIYQQNGWEVITPPRTELDLGSHSTVQAWLTANSRKIDVLINNAGENKIGNLDTLAIEDWERTLMVNLTSAMLLMQTLSRPMRAQKWGRIVNISSIFGLVSRAGRAPYAASKTGLIGLTRTAALEWGPENVLVNAICPGYIETDLTRKNNTPEQIRELARNLPLGRLGRPDEIARAVYFLGSDQNTFITGQSLTVDGGFTAQ